LPLLESVIVIVHGW